MIISKKEFIKIIDRLKKTDEIHDKVNDIFRNSTECIRSDFTNSASLMICHKDIVIDLLNKMFETDLVGWWIYDMNYGKEAEEGCLQKNGKNISVKTSNEFYDFLVKELLEERNK